MDSRYKNILFESTLRNLLIRHTLSTKSEFRFFDSLFSPKSSVYGSRAALVLMAERGETTDELLAAWASIRKTEAKQVFKVEHALDTCGTGGDGSDSINLSTLSSFVMAAAGVRVIKHGNRAITSRCGSSDLLEAFGFNLNLAPEKVLRSAAKTGMGYFHAPAIHPVYSQFQPLRRSIKVRTLFNLLGPVLNPVAVDYQILGVAKPELVSIYSKLLPEMGRKSALIIQGANGMDEITSLGISNGLRLSGKSAFAWKLNPSDYGFKKGNRSDLKINSISDAKKKAIQILKERKSGAGLDSVILSAACGIWISGKAKNLTEGVTLAKQVLHHNKAWMVLNQLIEFSKL